MHFLSLLFFLCKEEVSLCVEYWTPQQVDARKLTFTQKNVVTFSEENRTGKGAWPI